MPGLGINRLWWTGGRYAYVAAHFDGYTDNILCIVDLKTITKPEIVSRWWLPGMWRAGKEVDKTPKGKRVALHHMIVAGNRGYSAWRDGGFTIHDVSDPTKPKLLSHINWSPPFAGGTHTPLPLPGRKLAVVAEESNADNCAKGLFYTWMVDVRVDSNPLPIATLPTPKDRDYCQKAISGRTICMRTDGCFRARRRSSPPITMPAGVFDIKISSTEGIASGAAAGDGGDPRPNVLPRLDLRLLRHARRADWPHVSDGTAGCTSCMRAKAGAPSSGAHR
jgi:hypothetical protein